MIIPCYRRRSSAERQLRFAIWRLSPGTCCSVHVACTSAIPPCHATNANRVADVQQLPAAIARLRSWAQVITASLPIHPTCAWPWRHWKRLFTSKARRVHVQSHSAIFIFCPAARHIAKPCWSLATSLLTSRSRHQPRKASMFISSYVIARHTNSRLRRLRWC